MSYVVGVDGGATKTAALLGTVEGKVVGRGIAGTSNYHNVGPTLAGESIRAAVKRAQRNAKLTSVMPRTAVVALAAINSPRDLRLTERFVRRARIAEKAYAIHDTVAALCAATQGAPGIVVISGTGCVAAGINQAGKYIRVGGWGYLVNDEGSAYDVGKKALRATFRALDGRGPPTSLTRSLKHRFGVSSVKEIQNTIYTKNWRVTEIASLAPLVSRAAKSDNVCRDILKEAGMSLAELVTVTAKRLGMARTAFPVVTVGGNFKSGRLLLDPFTRKVRTECPRAKIEGLSIEPAKGALWLAASLNSPNDNVTKAAQRLIDESSPR
jgi:N-acetylglucosamine kinase